MRPKLSHKKPGVLPVEESCQVDLHFSWVWVFGLQLVEDELCDDVVLHAQQVVDPVGNPGLEDVQLDLGHVNFGGQCLLELHHLHKLLLLVAETVVLGGGCPLKHFVQNKIFKTPPVNLSFFIRITLFVSEVIEIQ